jgi:hypothetical protein
MYPEVYVIHFLWPVDFLIVPSKGLYGWGGRSSAIKLLYTPEPPEQGD